MAWEEYSEVPDEFREQSELFNEGHEKFLGNFRGHFYKILGTSRIKFKKCKIFANLEWN